MDDNNPFSNVVWWFKTRDTGELAFIGILALLGIILVYVLFTSGGDSDESNALADNIATGQVTQAPTVALAPTPTTIVIPTPMEAATPKVSADDLVAGTDNADKVETKKAKQADKAKKNQAGAAPAPTSTGSTGSTGSPKPAAPAPSRPSTASSAPAPAPATSGGTTTTAPANTGGTGGNTGATNSQASTGGNTNTDATATTEATAEPSPEVIEVEGSYQPPDAGLSHGTCDGVITFGGLCDDGTGYDNALNDGGNSDQSDNSNNDDSNNTGTPVMTATPALTPEPTAGDSPSGDAGAAATSRCDNGYRTIELAFANQGSEVATYIVSYQISSGSMGSESFTVDPGSYTTGMITGVNAGDTNIEVTVDGATVLTQSFAACS